VLFVRSIYFLGTDEQGNVAVYRGLPYELPLGVSLYSKEYSIPVQEASLSEDRQRAVTGHTLRGKDDATSLADDIQQRPTEGVPQPTPAPAPKKKKKKSGTGSKGKQAQKR
jgi:PPM family protein phosphatase